MLEEAADLEAFAARGAIHKASAMSVREHGNFLNIVIWPLRNPKVKANEDKLSSSTASLSEEEVPRRLGRGRHG